MCLVDRQFAAFPHTHAFAVKTLSACTALIHMGYDLSSCKVMRCSICLPVSSLFVLNFLQAYALLLFVRHTCRLNSLVAPCQPQTLSQSLHGHPFCNQGLDFLPCPTQKCIGFVLGPIQAYALLHLVRRICRLKSLLAPCQPQTFYQLLHGCPSSSNQGLDFLTCPALPKKSLSSHSCGNV